MSSSTASICWQTSLSRQIFWLLRTDSSTDFIQASRVPPSVVPGFVRVARHSEGPSAYTWTSVEQSCTTARSGERDFARHAIGSYGTSHPVWGEKVGTAMHCDTRESSGSGCRPVPECLVVACVSRHRHGTRRQVCNSQYLLFWPSSLAGATLDRFSSGSRDIREKVLLQSPTCAFDQYNQSIRNFVPTTALRGIRHVMAERHDKPQRVFNHTQRKHIFGSRWVECSSIKCVSVSASHVQETRQRSGKRVSRWWFTAADPILVHGAGLGGDWTQALGLHRRSALQRLECVHAHPFVWSSRFPGSTVGVGRESPKRNFQGVRLGTSRNDQAIFRVAQHCPCRYLVLCDAGGQRPRCRHDPGLVGTRCTAGHGQKDGNHRSCPAGRQARQGRRLTNPRCVRATHGWRRALQISARKPRRCTQGVRQISGSSNRSGHRQDHSRTSLPKGTHQQIGAHHQGVTRKEESAPGCGHEAVQGKRTSSSARAANPASTVRRCGRLEGAVLGGCLSGFRVKNGRGVRKRHFRFFRRILPRAGAPRRAQELFSRGPSFSFWFRPRNRHDVSYGVWFKRRPAHLVQNRRCSGKGCASNAGRRSVVWTCSRPNQHVHRRPSPQFAWHTRTTRQTAPSRIALLDRRRIQSRLGQRDKIQSGQVDRVGVHNRFSKSDGDRQDPSQNGRCVQAGCTKTVRFASWLGKEDGS